MAWGDFLGAIGSFLGSGLNAWNQNKINKENIALQREFAQNSIQWKVADAKKAGIHPLAALGASGYQASPSSVGADSGVDKGFNQLSQGLSKILDKNAQKLSDLQVRDAELEVLKKEKELQEFNQQLTGNNIFKPTGLGASIFQQPNGSAPTSGVMNNDAQANFNKSYNVGKNMLVSPLPGEKDFFLTFDPQSNQGQAMADASVVPPLMPLWDLWRTLDDKALDEIEDTMRSQGLITKNQRINRSLSNFSPYGYYIKLENGKSTTFKKQTPYQKFVAPIDAKNQKISEDIKKRDFERLKNKYLTNRRKIRGSFLNR